MMDTAGIERATFVNGLVTSGVARATRVPPELKNDCF